MARELDNLSGKLSPENRSGVGYLLRGATGSARGDIVREIIEIVRDVANGEQSDPLDDGLPGG
jgi:hypothetical protein